MASLAVSRLKFLLAPLPLFEPCASCIAKMMVYEVLEEAKKLSIAERFEKAKPLLKAIISEYYSPKAALITLRDKCYKILMQWGLASSITATCDQIGTHPINRWDTNIDPSEVIEKVKKLCKAGFSLSETHGAVCTEKMPGAKGDAYEQANAEVADRSNKMLMSVSKGSLKFFTITNSHTNQSMRSAKSGAPCDDPEVSHDGKLSMAKIRTLDPAYGHATDEGMKWWSISCVVEEELPLILQIIAEADNVPHAIAKQDTVFQIAFKAHKFAQQQARNQYEDNVVRDGAPVDWTLVATQVRRSELKHLADIDGVVSFVKLWSGTLSDPWVLREVDDWAKSIREPRNVTGETFKQLAELDIGPGVGAFWRSAVLKCCFDSDSKHVSNLNDSILFGASDFKAMGKQNKKFVLQADAMMRQARAIIAKEGDRPFVTSQNKVSLLGKLDCRLVLHVVQRPSAKYLASSSLGSVCYDYYQELSAAAGAGGLVMPLPVEWKPSGVKHTGTSQNAKSKSPVVALSKVSGGASTDKEMVELLKNKGIVVDKQVSHKQSNSLANVVKIPTDHVELLPAKAKNTIKVKVEDFLDLYAALSEKGGLVRLVILRAKLQCI